MSIPPKHRLGGLVACVIAASLAAPVAVFAQTASGGEPALEAKAGKELRAARIGNSAPHVDGQLDDEIWTRAARLEDMVQNEPDSMGAPSERTTIQVAYDDRDIYVAVRCYASDPSQIVSVLARRDTFPPSDLIRLSFDPRHDHSTAYVFHTNPAGVQMDDMWFDDTRFSPDYDAVWEVRTSIDREGWTAEFRIPFSQLRFSIVPGQSMVWGFNVRRDIYRRGEFDRWVATPRGEQGVVSRFGHLIFEDSVAPPRRLEVLPYTSVRSQHTPSDRADQDLAGGLDVRMGIGTANTLSATFNPDFGQVEQDPAVLNLSVFETFFPEKRPFFLEDSRVFVLPFPQFPVFHSRRIGQRPGRYDLHEGDTLISRPEQTTILGATKLTGKAGRWTYGALSALTSAEYATVDATTTGASGNTQVTRTERLIEPRTAYNVVRIQRDLMNATSNIGGVLTGVVRDGDADAYTGGVDYNIRWKRNQFRWDGHWIGTHAPVSDVVRDGFGGANRMNFQSKHVNFNAHVDHFSRYFRNADLGYLGSRPNKTATNGSVGIGQPDPKKYFRRVFGFFNAGTAFNDDVVFERWVGVGMDIDLPNFSYVGWNIGRNFETMDDLDTRGGPPIVTPASNWFNVFINSDSRKTWRFGVNAGVTRTAVGGTGDRVGAFVNLQPSSRMQASLSTNYRFGVTAAQWIDNIETDDVTDHIYGTLRQDVVDVTGRMTYAFTRDLTLQVFLQPFVAVGAYSDIRALAKPRSYEFKPATLDDNPDFNTKSVRTNTVLRWEYRPGSTLFVVWNRSGDDDSRPGVFKAWRDLGSAFGAEGSHVFMIKFNYWLGL
jgi:hypothetical protein